MTRLLIFAAGIILAGCNAFARVEPPPLVEQDIRVWHDDERAVTCWVYAERLRAAGGISCLPDETLP